jgi:adenylate cyclase
MIAEIVRNYSGRVVDSPGDNLLAEFSSVVDAVESAVEIQMELKSKNEELPEDRRMEFRIGINLGDVIEEGERIYGDGVNVAARIEGLAEGGGICISGTVYDHVENKLALEFKYLGEQAVKNIKKPLRVYRVRMERGVPDVATSQKLPLPDKPSIAVLPFVNMSGDAEQEYFSDGITEDLITDLSKISGLFVIARNSVFTYKGRAVKVDQVGQDLGVRYVLEGSVRKSGGRIRISAQLVDANTGGHLWANRYDRDLKDIFELQDEVTQKIVTSLAVKLTDREQDRLAHKDTANLEAYDYTLRGLEYYFLFREEANAEARKLFQKAIELDSEYALAHSRLGWTYLRAWSLGWTEDPKSLEQAFKMGQRAIALDETLPDAQSLLGEVYLWRKEHDHAIAALERSISLEPNNAEALADLANILSWAGRPDESVGLVKKAMRFNPVSPVHYLWVLGHAYYLKARYDETIATFKIVIQRQPDFLPAHAFLAASFIELGQEDEAYAEAEEVRRIIPNYSGTYYAKILPYKNQADTERLFAALRKAGLK